MTNFEEFQQEAWIEKFRKDFHYRFAYGFDEPDDVFASIVTDVLFAKLPSVSLTDKANPAAFVRAMLRNRARDYFTYYHKNHKPPFALRRLGEPYPQIFYEYCLGGFPKDVIADKLSLTLEIVNYWVQWLSQEKRCPESIATVSISDVGEVPELTDIPSFTPIVDKSATEQAYNNTFWAVLARWIVGDFANMSNDEQANDASMSSENTDISNNFQTMLERLDDLPELPITPDEALILKMIYFEDLKLKEVGEELNMNDHQVSYRREKIQQTLETYFKQQGIDYDD